MRGAVLEFYGYRNLNWIRRQQQQEERPCFKEVRAGSVGPRIKELRAGSVGPRTTPVL